MSESERRDYRSLGEILRDAREQRAWTLEKLSEVTKIVPRMLEALENDDLDRVADPVYARGFLRTVSDTLGLDTTWLLSRLEGMTAPVERAKVPPPSVPPPPRPSAGPIPVVSPVPGGQRASEGDQTWNIETVRVRRVEPVRGRSRAWILVLAIVAIAVLAALAWIFRGSLGIVGKEGPAAGSEPGVALQSPSSASEPGADDGQESSVEGFAVLDGSRTSPVFSEDEKPVTAESPPTPPPAAEVESEPVAERGTEAAAVASPPQDLAEEIPSVPIRGTTPSDEEDSDLGEGEEIVRAPQATRGLSSIVRPGDPADAIPMELIIRATARVEVWAAADGDARQRRVLNPGQSWSLSGTDHFSLEFADPDAVTLELDGVRRDPPPRLVGEWILYP